MSQRAERSSRPLELLRDAREVLPLVEGVLQLHLARPPRAVGGERARAVGAATLNLVHAEQLGAEGVAHRHKHHAVVSQLGNRCQPEKSGKQKFGHMITHCLWISNLVLV